MKKARWPLAIVLTALLGGGAWYASLHDSTGPAAGRNVEGPAGDCPNFRASENGTVPLKSPEKNPPQTGAEARDRTTLRLGTFNIHGGKGSDGRRDLDRVANCLRGLDFVALNEVHGRSMFGVSDQAEELGQRLQAQWLFAPADRQWGSPEFGNGLLARVPVEFWQRIPLPRQFDRSYRNMVLVGLHYRTAKNDPRSLRILLTHVNRRYDTERQAQLRTVIALYLALAEPAVLLGDLNSEADDPQIRRLLQTPGVSDAVGEKLGAKGTPARIDWIIVRGLRCVEAGLRDDGASDHPLVWAELELPP